MYRLFLDNLWRWKCELPEKEIGSGNTLELSTLEKSEWSNEFEKLMRNRLLVGSFRYGLLNAPGKPKYDCMESIRSRLDLYKKTKNKEHLVDIANLCLCEFEEGKGVFHSIDDGEHAKIVL